MVVTDMVMSSHLTNYYEFSAKYKVHKGHPIERADLFGYQQHAMMLYSTEYTFNFSQETCLVMYVTQK